MKTIYSIIILLLFICSSHSGAAIKSATDKFVHNHDSKEMDVWYHIPKGARSTSKVLFVMHGVKRNSKDYLDKWIDLSKKKKIIVIVPEFSKDNFPGSRNYNLANVTDSNGNVNDIKEWNFSIIEDIFHKFKSTFKIKTKQYYMYGHSAGSQFVHRFVMLYPESSLKLAISANAGWYTFPDTSRPFPYGLKELNYSKDELINGFSKKMVILLGTKDTDPNHKYLRNTPEAKLQGKHRLERGKNYFKSAQMVAKEMKTKLNWKMKLVPKVAHSNSSMSKQALKYIK